MKPEEFTSFDQAWPDKNKHVIVTNNINGTNAHGEMSHVWLTSIVLKDSGKPVVFTDGYNRLHNLSHWKYA